MFGAGMALAGYFFIAYYLTVPDFQPGGAIDIARAAEHRPLLLVVYCLRNVDIATAPHGLPELIALAVVTALHLWKRNVLLSIGAGTVVYMLLVQLVFA